jgi:pyruvate kinase
MADQSGASAIIAFAAKPVTAFRLASNRPSAPIYFFTNSRKIIQQLSLIWGVRAFFMDASKSIDVQFRRSIDILMKKALIKTDDLVVHVSSLPLFDPDGVNTIKLSYV